MHPGSDRQVAAWLMICCLMVFCIVVIGGITRLTHSGLSIVQWKPVLGTIPPLSEQQWQQSFSRYQRTPEFLKVNVGMTLAQFKGIYWWEYVHRLIGRLIGLAFLIPYLTFLIRRKVRGALAWKLLGIFLLGGAQGAMGWFMVKSGLIDNPRVSQYRLAAHLGLALLIFASMFWVALDLLYPRRLSRAAPELRNQRRFALGLVALVFVMALAGALVAGLHAGLVYNTFPLMDGHIVPPGIMTMQPRALNFFDNITTVQFDHRLLAWILALLVPWFWWRTQRSVATRRARVAAHVLLGAIVVQITLGIVTLLEAVPIPIAAAHQAGAVVVFASALFAAHCMRDSEALTAGGNAGFGTLRA